MKTVLLWLFLLLFLIAPDAFAGTSGASSIANQFIAQTASWYNEIKTVAEEIFYALFGIDFVYLVTQWLIGGKDVHEVFTSFIKKLMTIGFFYFLLMDGHTLVWDVINGFKQTATAAAGPVQTGLQGILQTGFDIFKTCVEGPMVPTKGGVLQYAWNVVTSDGKTLVSTLVGALVGILVGLIAILALIYLALEYLAIQVEASMVASIGVVMLGSSLF
ncbi:MAG: type IV secretion system protein [Acidithiobacillus caldus]|uniref:type IV secretion system protein n=1 Tax=Acidithiobacillus caldus TaxID=33059 RepID=UPI0028154DBA|nr:type IV secretion system protein [Acidithiobacillus caldus]WMT47882.1 MAG: type IV secretion system protein [Acidithiobacillus caldus]